MIQTMATSTEPSSTPQLSPTFTPQSPADTPIPTPTFTPLATDPLELAWEETGEDWGEFTCGEYLLANNVWGKGDLTDYDQTIGIAKTPDSCHFRWAWRWPVSSLNSVRAYPEIIYGWKPWSAASTTPSLPVQVSAIQALDVHLKFSTQPTGKYNSAFDLWLTSTNPPTGETITREIMIWVGEAAMSPAGAKVASLEIAGIPYHLYKEQWDWTYLAFTQQEPQPTETIPIAELLAYLVDNQYIQANEYLASIEFGNEVINGSGETLVDEFIVIIK